MKLGSRRTGGFSKALKEQRSRLYIISRSIRLRALAARQPPVAIARAQVQALQLPSSPSAGGVAAKRPARGLLLHGSLSTGSKLRQCWPTC
ncbi:hypothetical protein BDA96_03G191100 [Sorghum bicolor]|uniref:Uncharacterized protein n=2 Tax=Sorghum bicolor TaxID=4558 RepID=A0A921RCZ9_SORBI|nr:hypothetical protein BDA96_03G191100 [Sorghum bicolor]KXG32626.1 hypothetical protein SORBI_3003G176300 [Sorghum bicolor]